MCPWSSRSVSGSSQSEHIKPIHTNDSFFSMRTDALKETVVSLRLLVRTPVGTVGEEPQRHSYLLRRLNEKTTVPLTHDVFCGATVYGVTGVNLAHPTRKRMEHENKRNDLMIKHYI